MLERYKDGGVVDTNVLALGLDSALALLLMEGMRRTCPDLVARASESPDQMNRMVALLNRAATSAARVSDQGVVDVWKDEEDQPDNDIREPGTRPEEETEGGGSEEEEDQRGGWSPEDEDQA